MASSFHTVVAHVRHALADGLVHPQRADGADERGGGEEGGVAGHPLAVQLSVPMGEDASRNDALFHLDRTTGSGLRVTVEEVS